MRAHDCAYSGGRNASSCACVTSATRSFPEMRSKRHAPLSASLESLMNSSGRDVPFRLHLETKKSPRGGARRCAVTMLRIFFWSMSHTAFASGICLMPLGVR
eukprot:Amastigsp_a176098_5.p4 type:complete len:102 gc:universal Amastigsp_a176098_5:431-736(+)